LETGKRRYLPVISISRALSKRGVTSLRLGGATGCFFAGVLLWMI
jgi:hypothetical protein